MAQAQRHVLQEGGAGVEVTHVVSNHFAEYVNVTFRGSSTSSKGRGLTPIVLTLALITCGE